MERDYHELQRDHEMYKQRTGRAASEIENTNKKLNTQIHNDRKEIVRYREVSNVYLKTKQTPFVFSSKMPFTICVYYCIMYIYMYMYMYN